MNSCDVIGASLGFQANCGAHSMDPASMLGKVQED